jgi:hypothetical protein
MLGYGISNAECTGNNQVLLGNTSVTQIRASVPNLTIYSDARVKTNIHEDVHGLDFITRLRPITYQQLPEEIYRLRKAPESVLNQIDHSEIKSRRFLGLIAQEVDQALHEIGWLDFPGIDRPKSDDELYSLRYGDFVIPLIKAVQEQQQMIDAQNQRITSYEEKITSLQKENEELKAKLQSETEQLKAMSKRLELLERLVLYGTTQPETLGAK